jgi:hypothetical protein
MKIRILHMYICIYKSPVLFPHYYEYNSPHYFFYHIGEGNILFKAQLNKSLPDKCGRFFKQYSNTFISIFLRTY